MLVDELESRSWLHHPARSPSKEENQADVSRQLKNPPTQTLRVPEDPVLHPMPSLQVIMPSVHPELHELHPEPRLIYRFWQIFVESINPLTKVIHVPTMQERVLDASWNPEGIRTPLAAIMFAIYTLAVTASSSETCRAVFGELRGILLTRYRTAALRALVAAGFLETTELEVLQAWALLLFANPESDLCTALSGAAMSAARRMGLHRSGTDPSLSFFDTEMRIRLWWQLCGLEARAQANCSGGLQGPRFEVGDVRLPLNVNDSELHPDMVGSPAEHTGPTEMLFVLVKLAVTDWLRSSETATKAFGSIALAPVQDSATWTRPGDEVIDEIEQLYDARYLAAADKQIPLPALARATAQLAVARMRFRLHHPRRRRGVARGNPGDQPGRGPDVVFESALTIMEMLHQGRHSQFCGHLFTHMTSKPQLDACICVISELRRRCSGPRVDLAWELVEGLYLDHPELLTGSGSQGAFSVALRDLTLEAWDARQKKSAWRPGASAPSPTPGFVQMLLKERQEEGDQWPATMPEAGGAVESFGVAGDTSELDWDYWNDFLRL